MAKFDVGMIPEDFKDRFRPQEESQDLFDDDFGEGGGTSQVDNSVDDFFSNIDTGNSSSNSGLDSFFNDGFGPTASEEEDKTTEKLNTAIGGFFKGTFSFFKSLFNSVITKQKAQYVAYTKNMYVFSIFIIVFSIVLKLLNVAKFIFPVIDVATAGVIMFAVGFIIHSLIKDTPQAVLDTEEEIDFGEEEDEYEEEYEEEGEVELQEDSGTAAKENYKLITERVLELAPRNTIIYDRAFLFDVFKYLFIQNVPEFQAEVDLEYGCEDWMFIHYGIETALQMLFPTKVQGPISVVKMTKTFKTYVAYVKRINGITLQQLSQNVGTIRTFFKQYESDISTNVQISEFREFFIFRIILPQSKIVTVGDLYAVKKVQQFILDKKYILPIVVGYRQDGMPLCADLFKYPHMLVAGITGGGKSWFLFVVVAQLCALLPPTHIQFVLLDPVASTTFKEFEPLPHVYVRCGEERQFVQILRDVAKELDRRSKLFSEYAAENIKEYWRLCPEDPMPILVVVIDEINGLKGTMEPNEHKEFMNLLSVIVTRARKAGIKLIMLPQRARADVLDKTVKQMCDFRLGFKLSKEEMDFLTESKLEGVNLVNPGEAILKLGNEDPLFVVTPGLTTTDRDNAMLISALVKIWDKLGSEVPESPYLKKYKKQLNHDHDSAKVAGAHGAEVPQVRKTIEERVDRVYGDVYKNSGVIRAAQVVEDKYEGLPEDPDDLFEAIGHDDGDTSEDLDYDGDVDEGGEYINEDDAYDEGSPQEPTEDDAEAVLNQAFSEEPQDNLSVEDVFDNMDTPDSGGDYLRIKPVPQSIIKTVNGRPEKMTCREYILSKGGEVPVSEIVSLYTESEIDDAKVSIEIIETDKKTFITI